MNEQAFIEWTKAQGWVQAQDGSWNPPAKSKSNAVGAVEVGEHKPEGRLALEPKARVLKRRPRRVVVVVTLVSFRKREIDSDHLADSFTPLRNSVARSIGLDDGDKRFVWEYRQVETKGEEGSLIRIALK